MSEGRELVATVINTRQRSIEELPKIFFELLPCELYSALKELAARGIPIDEVRLRSERMATVTSGGKNIVLNCILSKSQMEYVFDSICEHSLYAHADTIKQGYITLDGGIRVGIVGRASVVGESVIGVYDVSALSFRLPRRVRRVGAPVCELLKKTFPRGVLVYSPPAHGKTTLLRAVIAAMASGSEPWRVAVIDSRGELGFSLDEPSLCVDVLYGYPRPLGIEIAARSMNAQLIVCDEIGAPEEARAIIAAQNCGVPLLATAHGDSFEGIMRRTGIAMLDEAGVFGAYVGIERRGNARDYIYTVTESSV